MPLFPFEMPFLQPLVVKVYIYIYMLIMLFTRWQFLACYWAEFWSWSQPYSWALYIM